MQKEEKRDKYNDDKQKKTTSSRSSVNNLAMEVRKMSWDFTLVNTQLQRLKEADFDLSDSEYEVKHQIFRRTTLILVKVTSNFHSWTGNSKPTSQVFSTRIPVVTSE